MRRSIISSLALVLLAGTGVAAEPAKAPPELAVRANTDLGIALYHQLAKEKAGKNLFFSPYSIANAMTMATEGARGETALEMGQVLRFPKAVRQTGEAEQPWNMSLLHIGLANINRSLMQPKDSVEIRKTRAVIAKLRDELDAAKKLVKKYERGPFSELRAAQKREKVIVDALNAELSKVDQYEIRVANALWGEKSYPFRKDYLSALSTHYDTGGLIPVDFRTEYEAARLRINKWVEDQTNDKIKDLIPKGAVNEATRLVLTNAVYFKGEWEEPFEKKSTEPRDFTSATGQKAKVPIMYNTVRESRYGAFEADGSLFRTPTRRMFNTDPKTLYPGADGFSMVELPYKGDALSMVVLAPNDPKGLAALEKKLTAENLARWTKQLVKRKTHVYLPKFEMKTDYTLGDSDNPKSAFRQMGMNRAFTDPRDPKNGAQFQGMTDAKSPMEQLYISKVLHKAFVEVNEKGTEAAAATAVIFAKPTSAPVSLPFTPKFMADRPFVFLIRHKATGCILFLGRVMQPKA